MLKHLPHGLRAEFLQAMLNTQPNTQLVQDALLRAKPSTEPKLERRSPSGSTNLAWYDASYREHSIEKKLIPSISGRFSPSVS
jgi:hypothetical protein